MVDLISFSLVLIILGVILKIYIKLSVKHNGCYKCLVGKTAVVTGSNTGIGYITALDFAKRGCKVILACRNKVKAEAAVFEIQKETNNKNVIYKHLDLSSFKSIRDFAGDFNQMESKLDILVNNAGGIGFENKFTDDGLQVILQTNYAGPFLLTHLLLDKLKKSESGRIVNVAALAGRLAGNIDLNDLNKHPKDATGFYSPVQTYKNTKLCNILFTIELAKKLYGTNVTTNTLHPGIIDTNFLLTIPFFRKLIQFIGKFYFLTPLEGAQTTIYVALSNDLEGVSGKLFDNCREVGMYSNAKDPNMAKKLWEISEKWCKIEENEKIR
ncbi:retinol dehydrogenase 14-like isoform X2 [Onthophagus taurus]|uniref:retinol dehydrogenase 14-like isoform X2 n=1 Tax=Onthophagus taurus TaxID=166361 RepID=UPI0039BE0A31